MSFSSTHYRVSEEVFDQLKAGLIKPSELVSKSKEFATCQDSCDAIRFILKKKSDSSEELIDEIFLPAQRTGSVSDEQFQNLIESQNYQEIDRLSASIFEFLPPDKIMKISSLLDTVDKTVLSNLYDPNELNSRNVYPSLWTAGEDRQRAYNFSHFYMDLESVKTLFKNASLEKDYILVFTG